MATNGVLVRDDPVTLEYSDIPMVRDRGRGWEVIRDAGPVVRLGDLIMVT